MVMELMEVVDSTIYISGTVDYVQVPVAKDIMLINHTHPSGSAYPSSKDMKLLGNYQRFGSPQLSSEIIPIGKNNIRFNINGLIGGGLWRH